MKKYLLINALIMPFTVLAEQTAEPVAITAPMEIQQPNLYDLKNGTLQISYSVSSADGLQHFSYKNGKIQRSFSGDEIRTSDTDLGTVVSVTTTMSVDTGSTSFSVLIPRINLDNTLSAVIKTQGIETKHKFSIIPSFIKGQVDTYKFTSLTGKASLVTF